MGKQKVVYLPSGGDVKGTGCTRFGSTKKEPMIAARPSKAMITASTMIGVDRACPSEPTRLRARPVKAEEAVEKVLALIAASGA